MTDLTEPQRSFVRHYVDLGGENATEAARRAGYGTNSDTQAVIASNMLTQPRILAALRELADQRLRSGVVIAASVLVEIAKDRFHKERYKAAVELLNRAGLVVEGVSRIIVEDHRTPEEIERRIKSLAEKVGVDWRRLLGTVAPEAIDAEFTEVDLQEKVDEVREEMDQWQKDQAEFDAMLERSTT